MADPFVAEIRIFPFNFAPKNWAFCNGQLMPITQNTALFSLLGTTYGGNGQSNFALPNMQGNVPMHPGQGPGLSLHTLGESSGSETVTLLESEIPSHSHTLRANNNPAESSVPASDASIARQTFNLFQTTTNSNLVAMAIQSLPVAGSGLPHNNMMPYLTLNFSISLLGVFPQRP